MKFPAVCLLFLFTGSNRAQIPASPQTLEVAMRDGIRLSTDVYGSTPGVRWPALLMRTPYNKRGAKATAERFAAAGYVAIVQDTRGAFASEGKYVHYNNDDQDGFDAIEWIVQQPWSNGNVGMWGSSHPGAVQWVAAADRADGLVVVAPTAAPAVSITPCTRAAHSVWGLPPGRVSPSIPLRRESSRRKISRSCTITCRSQL